VTDEFKEALGADVVIPVSSPADAFALYEQRRKADQHVERVQVAAEAICHAVCPEGAHEQGENLCYEVAEMVLKAALIDGHGAGGSMGE
jgi:hypothetical protein